MNARSGLPCCGALFALLLAGCATAGAHANREAASLVRADRGAFAATFDSTTTHGSGRAPPEVAPLLDPVFQTLFDSAAARVHELHLNGWSDQADSLAQRFASEAETRYGPASLETAEALDLAVWAAVSTNNQYVMRLSGHTRARAGAVQEAARRALKIRESHLGTDDPRVGTSLERLARVEWALDDTAASRVHAERSLAVREARLGPDHPDVARSLHLLAGLLDSNPHLARRFLERALSIRERALGSEDLEVARTLMDLTEVGGISYEEKIAYLRRALRIVETQLGPRHYQVANVKSKLSQYLRAEGVHTEAEQLMQSALDIAKSALGPKHPAVADYYNLLGVYLMRTDPEQAAPLLECALELGGGNLAVLSNLGGTYYFLGRYEQARYRFEQAIRNAEETLGPQSTWTAYCHTMYGNSLVYSEDAYLEAENQLRQAVEIGNSIPAPDRYALRNQAGAFIGLAEIASRTGDAEQADTLFRRAVNMLAESWPGYYEHGEARSTYASALLRAGDPRGAIEQSLLAAAHLDTLLTPNDAIVVGNVQVRARAYLALGETETARSLLADCLQKRERSLGADHPGVAVTLLALAECDRVAGLLDSAATRFARGASILEKTLGRSNPQVAASLRQQAEVELALGDHRAALTTAIRAEEAGREHLRRTAEGLSERRALAYAGIRNTGLDCALTAAGADPRPQAVRTIWDAVLRSRGLVLDEMAVRHRTLVAIGDAETDSLVHALRDARSRLASLAVRGAGLASAARGRSQLPVEKMRALYRNAERERDQLEDALAQRSLAFRRERARAAVDYEQVARALPVRAALVAYARYEVPTSREERYAALVMRHGGEPALVPLDGADELDRAVERWRTEASRDRDNVPRCQAAGEALRARIWDPVARHLAGAERVYIVPEGALSLVPFGALPDAEGRYLVETGPTLHVLSAERDLVMPEDAATGSGLLAFGDPQFDGHPKGRAVVEGARRGRRSVCREFRAERFPQLPETAAEVAEVGALWRRADVARHAEVLLGPEASEAAFKSRAPGHRVLHVATHGFFLGGECRSALESKRGMNTIATTDVEIPPLTEVGESPLLLSGLALAGANRRDEAGPDEEDGILTAEEIASLNLSGVEWAVLSACETGVGEVRPGEGVFGLRRAFQVAGARTLIMSLWSVEDEATRAWMAELYRARLERGLDTAESVRAASLAVLAERRAKGESTHPFYWGAFVAAGDWR